MWDDTTGAGEQCLNIRGIHAYNLFVSKLVCIQIIKCVLKSEFLMTCMQNF